MPESKWRRVVSQFGRDLRDLARLQDAFAPNQASAASTKETQHLAVVFDSAANLILEQSQQAQYDLIFRMVPTANIDLDIPVGFQADVGDSVASA